MAALQLAMFWGDSFLVLLGIAFGIGLLTLIFKRFKTIRIIGIVTASLFTVASLCFVVYGLTKPEPKTHTGFINQFPTASTVRLGNYQTGRIIQSTGATSHLQTPADNTPRPKEMSIEEQCALATIIEEVYAGRYCDSDDSIEDMNNGSNKKAAPIASARPTTTLPNSQNTATQPTKKLHYPSRLLAGDWFYRGTNRAITDDRYFTVDDDENIIYYDTKPANAPEASPNQIPSRSYTIRQQHHKSWARQLPPYVLWFLFPFMFVGFMILRRKGVKIYRIGGIAAACVLLLLLLIPTASHKQPVRNPASPIKNLSTGVVPKGTITAGYHDTLSTVRYPVKDNQGRWHYNDGIHTISSSQFFQLGPEGGIFYFSKPVYMSVTIDTNPIQKQGPSRQAKAIGNFKKIGFGIAITVATYFLLRIICQRKRQ